MLLFAALAVITAAGLAATRTPDSSTYLHVDLTGGTGRLLTVPALFSIAPNDGARVGLQVLIAVTSWGFLAVAVRRTTRSPIVGFSAMSAVLVLALTPAISEWNIAILSESVAISITIATLASWLWWMRARSTGWLVAATVVTAVFVCTRLLHIPVGAGIALALLAVARRSTRRRPLYRVSGALLVCCALAGALAIQNRDIPRSNAMSIVVDRIAQRPADLRYFRDHGLPSFSREQRGLIGDYLGNEESFLGDRHLTRWIDEQFLQTYTRYLTTRPQNLVIGPSNHAYELLAKPANYSDPRPVLPAPTDALLYGWLSLRVLLLVTAVVAVASSRSRRFRRSPMTSLGVAAVVVACFWAVSTYLLSANELPRLGVPAGVTLRVGLLLVLASAVDSIVGRRAGW